MFLEGTSNDCFAMLYITRKRFGNIKLDNYAIGALLLYIHIMGYVLPHSSYFHSYFLCFAPTYG